MLQQQSPFTFTSRPTTGMSNVQSSPATQAAIEKLPAEVLSDCLRLLPTNAAKSARLVCRRWSDSISRWLFYRVYFRPHPEIMDVFEQITSNPLYAVGVTELVYDARMFLSVPSFAGNTEEQKNRLFREQQEVLDQAVDFHHLVSGLERLPNLKSVQVLEILDAQLSCKSISTGKTDDFKHYNKLCQRLWKTLSMRLNTSALIATRPATQRWDARGVEHLFQALTMRSPQLLHLCCGEEDTGLPLKLLDAGISSTLFRHLAQSLTCLSIVDDGPCSVSKDSQYLQVLAKSITHAQNLKFLSLHMRDMPGMDLETVFSGALWPNLSSLTLWDWHFRPENLIALCYRHKDTLQQLALNRFCLKASLTTIPWEEVCQKLGHLLRLHYIRLYAPHEYPTVYGTTKLAPLRNEGLVRRIMRWAPQGMLQKESHDVIRLRTSSLSLPPQRNVDTYLTTGLDTVCGSDA